ncbi:MAG: HU family DNA-binding protein [Pseudomonadota bacterium]
MDIDKKDFVAGLAKKFSITKTHASILVDAFTETLRENIAAGNNVSIEGLGSFKVQNLFPDDFDPKSAKVLLKPHMNRKLVHFDMDIA